MKIYIERQCEVERILSDRLLPIDIRVYTPHEIRFLFSEGSPFIEEVEVTAYEKGIASLAARCGGSFQIYQK